MNIYISFDTVDSPHNLFLWKSASMSAEEKWKRLQKCAWFALLPFPSQRADYIAFLSLTFPFASPVNRMFREKAFLCGEIAYIRTCIISISLRLTVTRRVARCPCLPRQLSLLAPTVVIVIIVVGAKRSALFSLFFRNMHHRTDRNGILSVNVKQE
jgi:hypothetical protein